MDILNKISHQIFKNEEEAFVWGVTDEGYQWTDTLYSTDGEFKSYRGVRFESPKDVEEYLHDALGVQTDKESWDLEDPEIAGHLESDLHKMELS
jgi:hypothetical protein